MEGLTRILLLVKHRVPAAWHCVELTNAKLFGLLHGSRMAAVRDEVLSECQLHGASFRALHVEDMPALHRLLLRQSAERLKYFKPHGFDREALDAACRNPAFLMFGAFIDGELVGYFFLRCFWNRRCFVGRLIDAAAEGRGIGRVMNRIMYETAWRAGFRCLSTVSTENASVMRSHSRNPHMRVLKRLAGDYLLIEFVR